MTNGSGSGLLDPFLRRYIFALLGEGGSIYFQYQSGALLWKADPLIFGAKMAPCCGGWIWVLETHLLDPVI
jgi:hypothetical protein